MFALTGNAYEITVFYSSHHVPGGKRTSLVNGFTDDTDPRFLSRERQKARALRSSQWWKRRLARGRCYYCGRSFAPEDLTMDHIVPLSRGGRSTKGNVVTACKTCNNKKKYMLPIEWREYLETLKKEEIE